MAVHEGSPKGGMRRTQILETAVQMFGEVGYRNTSLRDIAAKVGITHPGLLYHFHSKEELLLEVLALRDEENRRQFPLDESLPAIERLAGFLDLVAHNTMRHGLVEMFSTLSTEAAAHDHPTREYFAQRYANLAEANEKMFTELADQGLLRPDVEPSQAARCVLALVDGLQVQWLYDPVGVDMPAQVRGYLDSILVRPLADLLTEQDSKVA